MTNRTELTISLGTMMKIAVFIAFVWLFAYLIELVLIILTALIIASAIEPAVRKLTTWNMPRFLAVIFVYLLTISGVVAFIYFLIPVVFEQGRNLIASLPDILSQTQEFFTESRFLAPIFNASTLETSSTVWAERVAGLLQTTSSVALSTTSVFFNGLITIILITILSFYFSVEEKNVTRFIEVISPNKYSPYVIDLWYRSKIKIGQWMKGQIVLVLTTGVLVYLGLVLIGVPNPLLFAVIAGVMEIIPIFGAFIAATPPAIIAFVEGGWVLGVITIGFFVFIQQFQSNLVYPLVVKKVVGVPSILVILALVVGATLAGVLGIIISVPLAAVLQELFLDLRDDRIKSFVKKQ